MPCVHPGVIPIYHRSDLKYAQKIDISYSHDMPINVTFRFGFSQTRTRYTTDSDCTPGAARGRSAARA